MQLGISLFIKSMLGNAPISSAPYILSLRYPASLGVFNFIVNMIFLLGQILVLRKQFKFIQLLQIPMTVIFSFFIDLTMLLLGPVAPETYISRFATLLLGSSSIGLGIALEIIGNVITLPGDGAVKAIATRWHFDFGYTKTGLDIVIVLIAATLSWVYFGEIRAIREGTLVSALITGSIARFFIKQLSYLDQNANRVFKLPFTSFSYDDEEKPNYQYD